MSDGHSTGLRRLMVYCKLVTNYNSRCNQRGFNQSLPVRRNPAAKTD